MEALLCLQVFAPYPLHPPLPYPDHTSTATLTPTPTLPSWYHGTIASFIFAIQKSFGIPDSREGASDLESGGTHVHSFSVVPASGGGGARLQSASASMMEPSTHLFSRLRRRVWELLEQSLRLRWAGPLLLFSTRMRAWISVFIWNCTMVLTSGLEDNSSDSECCSSPHGSHSWMSVPHHLFGWFPLSLQHLDSSPERTHYGCHGVPSHALCPTHVL